MNKYKELAETFFEASNKLRFECLKHIKEILNKCPDRRVSWLTDDLYDMGFDSIYISYDGGNHPEYASNVFSEVEAVYLDEYDNIVVDCEDGRMYAENITNTAELYEVCDFIECYSTYEPEDEE